MSRYSSEFNFVTGIRWILNNFVENTQRMIRMGFGMDEEHRCSTRTESWLAINEPESLGLEPLEYRLGIFDPESDMDQSSTSSVAVDLTLNRRLRVQRLHQLNQIWTLSDF